MFDQVIYSFLVFYFSLLFHEIGHWLYLKEHLDIDGKIKFKYGFPKEVVWMQEKEISAKEEVNIHMWGIFAGIIPFLVFSESIHIIVLSALFITYGFACKNDILLILGRNKDEKENNTLQ